VRHRESQRRSDGAAITAAWPVDADNVELVIVTS
jgi:hypothetical protein